MVKCEAVLVLLLISISVTFGRNVDKRKCPEVRATPHFDLSQVTSWPRAVGWMCLQENVRYIHQPGDVLASATDRRLYRMRDELSAPPGFIIESSKIMLGDWFVVEYYASEEEALSYSCMKSVFTEEDHIPAADGTVEWAPGVTMNFTYRFADDPLGENLLGNITWRVDMNEPAHWTHAERTYDGVYNTYVLDTEYKTWALLLHCAEQTEGARYLAAFILSRTTALPKNVMAYLRDKLPRYDVDINYVFPIPHKDCSDKPARPDYSPILLEAGSKVPKRPGVSYDVSFDLNN